MEMEWMYSMSMFRVVNFEGEIVRRFEFSFRIIRRIFSRGVVQIF